MIKIPDVIRRKDAIDAADSIINRDTSGNNDVVKAMTAWKEYIKGLPSMQDEIASAVAAVIEQPEEDCDSCKHGWFGSVECDNCRVGYPSHYERGTDE